MPAELHLLRPAWLLALIPLALLLWWLARRPAAADAWRGVVDAHLLGYLMETGGRGGPQLSLALLAVGWTLAVLALAGPAWEELPRPVYQADVRRVIALDISPAMNAPDLPPSRLVRARFEVIDLLARAAEGQTALLAYGPEPFVVSPLTTDADTIAAQIPDLTSELLPVKGTARADLALGLAGELLERAGSREGDVILVTGELDDPEAARRAAADLRERGFRVSVLGVGTAAGAPVPLADGGFLTGEDGAILLPRLDVKALSTLAAAGGGLYRAATADDADARALVPEAGPDAGRVAVTDTEADQWREEGPWLLLLLVPLAALAFRRGWLGPLVLLVLILPHPRAEAIDWTDLWLRADQQGARALAQGDPRAAAEAFRRPDWRAAAEYEAGDYSGALEALADLGDSESAYNRGNALARLGRLEQAIAEYERVLAAAPGHADARHNRDLLRDLLARRQPGQPPPDAGQPPPEGGEERGGGSGQERGGGGSGAEPDAGGDGAGGRGEGGGNSAGAQEGGGGAGTGGAGGTQNPAPAGGEAEAGGSDAEGAGGAGAGDQPAPAGTRDGGGTLSAQNPRAAQGTDGARAPRPGGEQGPDAPAGGGAEPAADESAQNPVGPGAGARPGEGVGAARTTAGAGEQDQATEHLLRRVPDDPGGLLRERFLLQHLRRGGRLP